MSGSQQIDLTMTHPEKSWPFSKGVGDVPSLLKFKEKMGVEEANRKKLASGVPPSATSCALHQEALGYLASQKNQKPGDPNFDIVLAQGPEVRLKKVKVLEATSLLPHCANCFHDACGLPRGIDAPKKYDGCTCATLILTSDCYYCALGSLEQKYQHALRSRSWTEADGKTYVGCECGRAVVVAEAKDRNRVRKCVGCDGVVTAPCTNFAKKEVQFEQDEVLKADVPAIERARAAARKLEDARAQHERNAANSTNEAQYAPLSTTSGRADAPSQLSVRPAAANRGTIELVVAGPDSVNAGSARIAVSRPTPHDEGVIYGPNAVMATHQANASAQNPHSAYGSQQGAQGSAREATTESANAGENLKMHMNLRDIAQRESTKTFTVGTVLRAMHNAGFGVSEANAVGAQITATRGGQVRGNELMEVVERVLGKVLE